MGGYGIVLAKDTRGVGEMTKPALRCPECRSRHIVRAGRKMTRRAGRKQRFLCADCGRSFYAPPGADTKRRTQ